MNLYNSLVVSYLAGKGTQGVCKNKSRDGTVSRWRQPHEPVGGIADHLAPHSPITTCNRDKAASVIAKWR